MKLLSKLFLLASVIMVTSAKPTLAQNVTQKVCRPGWRLGCAPIIAGGCGNQICRSDSKHDSAFISQGGDYYCYKEYTDALAGAMAAAESNAQKLCEEKKSWRISEFEFLQGHDCYVLVQAKYLCK